MPERDGYIPGVPCWVDTSQPDPAAAAAFYSGLFGWEVEDVMPPEADGSYFVGRIRGGDVAAISAIPEGAPPMAVWKTYIEVESADATAATVTDAGGTTLMGPFDVMDAGRMAVFADPEGAAFCVWEAKEHKGAQVVNEAGALNFNGLNTRDVDGAKAFYGAVFGWSTLDLGGVEMWTLPGYGDHLELSTPGLREQMAEFGGPAGFEDVVATINALGDDQPDVPAHWSVTFGVDDADACAAKAAELGGTVLVAPFDAPWVRMAVLADPAGATFIASQFVPENRGPAAQPDSAASAA
ncbi:MAG TPA: VOC family protein [Solirubrobacteraceae bacterium]|nr:VOC family protein [Solirubrobacteraceae bacterium]